MLPSSDVSPIVVLKEQSDIWNTLLPGLIGAIVGTVVTKVWSYFDEGKARRRECNRFLADQANRLVEDLLRIFIAARTELGYLSSELHQLGHQIAFLQEREKPFRARTGESPFQEPLRQAQAQQAEFTERAYGNLKRLHAQGEHALRMLLSIPLAIDFRFLNNLFEKLTDSYPFDAQGVAKKTALYDELYPEMLAARNKCLTCLLGALEK